MSKTHIRHLDAWREISEVHVKHSSSWREVKEIWVKHSNTWRKVFSKTIEWTVTAGQDGNSFYTWRGHGNGTMLGSPSGVGTFGSPNPNDIYDGDGIFVCSGGYYNANILCIEGVSSQTAEERIEVNGIGYDLSTADYFSTLGGYGYWEWRNPPTRWFTASGQIRDAVLTRK